MDVGHYWLDGVDPLPYLQKDLERTRVVHLHAVLESAGQPRRDHQSLAQAATDKLEAVLELLTRRKFAGVATMEVFGEADFLTSLARVRRSLTGWTG